MLNITDNDLIVDSLPYEADEIQKIYFRFVSNVTENLENRLRCSKMAYTVEVGKDRYLKFALPVSDTMRHVVHNLLSCVKLCKQVTEHYLACAFWLEQSDYDNEVHFEETHEVKDLSPEAAKDIIEDIIDFVMLLNKEVPDWQNEVTAEQLGHDFFLTRNGHGAGFWDREYETEGLGDKLTELCKPYGTQGLYLGDDGLIYTHN